MIELVYGAAADITTCGLTEYILTDPIVHGGVNLFVHLLAPEAKITYIVRASDAALLDFTLESKDTVPFNESYQDIRKRYLNWKLSELVLHYTNILVKCRKLANEDSPESRYVYRQVQVLEDIFVQDLIALPTIIELLVIVEKLKEGESL